MNLQSLVVPLLMDLSKYNANITEAQTKAKSLSGGLASIGGGAFAVASAGIAAGVGAITAVTIDSISKTSEWGKTLDDIGDILGTDSKQSAGLALMVQRVGGSSEQLTSALAIMAKGLTDAEGKAGTTGQVINGLGIDFRDANGNIKDSTILFGEIATKVSAMPDGLEKTQLEMQLFGKSGKEMGDILNEAANGGVSNYIDEAEKLGLALSDKQTQQTIDYQKSQEKLDATFLGLKTTLGTTLIPVLTKLNDKVSTLLADPKIKENISKFGTAIGDFALKVITNLPLIVTKLENMGNWFKNNQGIIIGILAALGIAILAFGVQSMIAGIMAMAPWLPVIGILMGIALVVGLVATAWKKNWGGIQEKVQAAGTVIKKIWESYIKPPLQALWNFLNTYIFPIFQAIGQFVGAVFSVYFKILGAIINTFVITPFKLAYTWMNDKVFPVIKNIATWVSTKLSPAFQGLSGFVQKVVDWFKKLASSLSALKLPKWLTPGSPFPFTISLMGLNKELEKSVNSVLPQFATQLNIGGSMPNLSTPTSNNISNSNADIIKALNNNKIDYDRLARAVVQATLTA